MLEIADVIVSGLLTLGILLCAFFQWCVTVSLARISARDETRRKAELAREEHARLRECVAQLILHSSELMSSVYYLHYESQYAFLGYPIDEKQVLDAFRTIQVDYGRIVSTFDRMEIYKKECPEFAQGAESVLQMVGNHLQAGSGLSRTILDCYRLMRCGNNELAQDSRNELRNEISHASDVLGITKDQSHPDVNKGLLTEVGRLCRDLEDRLGTHYEKVYLDRRSAARQDS